jgi:ferredoxin-NADP reductase
MSHLLTLKTVEPVTHDTLRLTMDRPEDLSFAPGQAALVTLDREGWREEERPFTFVSQPEDPFLAFIIKTYPEHEGMTAQLRWLEPGDRIQVGDPWGAIQDKGPGTFIAGGAGVTPFIAILRRRQREGTLAGCRLLFSNKAERDIILREAWEQMDDLDLHLRVTEEEGSDLYGPRYDETELRKLVDEVDQPFYVCGPPAMVEDVTAALKAMGADPDGITLED